MLFAVTKLGTAVRKALGDATSESAQRLSMETLTAASLEAVHEYAAGLDAQSAGKFEETLQHLSRAVDLDPNFGMAYTVMAGASRNLGRQQDAEKYIREAIKHIDHMTEREHYRTRAFLYFLTGDQQKCVDEYGALLERYPADTRGIHQYRRLPLAFAQHAQSSGSGPAGGGDPAETGHLPRESCHEPGLQRRFARAPPKRPSKR